MKLYKLFQIIFVSLILAGCEHDNKSKTSFSGEILRIIYGNYNDSLNSSYIYGAGEFENTFANYNSDTIFARIELIDTIILAKDSTFFVLTTLEPNNYLCPTCAPIIEASVFKSDRGSLVLINHNRIGQYGSMGKPPECTFIKSGEQSVCLLLESYFINQGISSSTISLYNYIDNSWIPTLTIENFSGDNSGLDFGDSLNYWSYNSRIVFNPSKEIAYSLWVKTTGTIYDSLNKISPIAKNEFFEFNLQEKRYIKTTFKH